MALPLLGLAGLARAGTAAIPQAGTFLKKNGGEIADLTANFFKKDDNKDNLTGKNGDKGLVKGFTDLMKDLGSGKTDALLNILKSGMGMEDEAFSAFSKLFKQGNFSGIPTNELFSAGNFLYNMVS